MSFPLCPLVPSSLSLSCPGPLSDAQHAQQAAQTHNIHTQSPTHANTHNSLSFVSSGSPSSTTLLASPSLKSLALPRLSHVSGINSPLLLSPVRKKPSSQLPALVPSHDRDDRIDAIRAVSLSLPAAPIRQQRRTSSMTLEPLQPLQVAHTSVQANINYSSSPNKTPSLSPSSSTSSLPPAHLQLTLSSSSSSSYLLSPSLMSSASSSSLYSLKSLNASPSSVIDTPHLPDHFDLDQRKHSIASQPDVDMKRPQARGDAAATELDGRRQTVKHEHTHAELDTRARAIRVDREGDVPTRAHATRVESTSHDVEVSRRRATMGRDEPRMLDKISRRHSVIEQTHNKHSKNNVLIDEILSAVHQSTGECIPEESSRESSKLVHDASLATEREKEDINTHHTRENEMQQHENFKRHDISRDKPLLSEGRSEKLRAQHKDKSPTLLPSLSPPISSPARSPALSRASSLSPAPHRQHSLSASPSPQANYTLVASRPSHSAYREHVSYCESSHEASYHCCPFQGLHSQALFFHVAGYGTIGAALCRLFVSSFPTLFTNYLNFSKLQYMSVSNCLTQAMENIHVQMKKEIKKHKRKLLEEGQNDEECGCNFLVAFISNGVIYTCDSTSAPLSSPACSPSSSPTAPSNSAKILLASGPIAIDLTHVDIVNCDGREDEDWSCINKFEPKTNHNKYLVMPSRFHITERLLQTDDQFVVLGSPSFWSGIRHFYVMSMLNQAECNPERHRRYSLSFLPPSAGTLDQHLHSITAALAANTMSEEQLTQAADRYLCDIIAHYPRASEGITQLINLCMKMKKKQMEKCEDVKQDIIATIIYL